MAAKLLFQTNPEGEGLFSCVQISFVAIKLHRCWPREWMRFIVIQLFRERLPGKMCTRQSRKVIWDMINTRCSWHCSCRTYLCCFLLAPAKIRPWPLVSFFQCKLLWITVNSKPLTMTFNFRIVAYTFCDNLSRNSGIFMAHFQLTLLFAIFKHAVRAKGRGGEHVLLLF